MCYKAAIVLCLHALYYGFQVGGEDIDSTKTYADIETVFCEEETIQSDGFGKFKFPKTEASIHGVNVKVACPFGFRNDGLWSFYESESSDTVESKMAQSGVVRECILHDSGNERFGRWHPPGDEMEIKYCKQEACGPVFELWRNATKYVTASRFRQLLALMSEVHPCAINDYDYAVEYINGIDTLLTTNPALGPEALSMNDRDTVLSFVGRFAQSQAAMLQPGFKSQIGNAGIVVETAKFHGMKRHLNFLKKSSLDEVHLQLQPYITNFVTVETKEVDVGVSAEALLHSMENVPDKDPLLKITVYSSDVFKVWNEKRANATRALSVDELAANLSLLFRGYDEIITNNCTDNVDSCDPSLKTWGMLSIELDGEIHDLQEPIEFTIKNFAVMDGSYQMKCVYWDTETETWSTEGLETIPIPEGAKCRSTHLTAFSALIEPVVGSSEDDFANDKGLPDHDWVHGFILSILSSIGSVCSIVGLGLTLLTYGLFRSLRRERSNRILINLCTSLLLLHIMSISGSKSLWEGYCLLPAASLHYFVLTSLAWMMVEAIHMYELLISVFVRPENRFLIKRLVLAWGIPLIIVGICVSVHPDVYKVGRNDLCLMSAQDNIALYYTAYIGPICIMLLINMSIFLRVFRVLYQQTKRTTGGSHGQKKSPGYQFVKISPSQIKGATTVLVLLGIGWVFGLLAVGPFETFFKYMYCICNAGQGLLIFIFRVLLNPQASKQWKKVIIGLSSDSSLDTSVATSTTESGKDRKRKSTMISPTFISASNSVENSLTASNPLSTTLATTLASILRSEDLRAVEQSARDREHKIGN